MGIAFFAAARFMAAASVHRRPQRGWLVCRRSPVLGMEPRAGLGVLLQAPFVTCLDQVIGLAGRRQHNGCALAGANVLGRCALGAVATGLGDAARHTTSYGIPSCRWRLGSCAVCQQLGKWCAGTSGHHRWALGTVLVLATVAGLASNGSTFSLVTMAMGWHGAGLGCAFQVHHVGCVGELGRVVVAWP